MEPLFQDLPLFLTLFGFETVFAERPNDLGESVYYQLKIDEDNVITLCIVDEDIIIRDEANKDIAKFKTLEDASKHMDSLLSRHELEVFSCVALCNPSDTKTAVQAAITTRDLAKNLVRVKSSNVWAYTINIRDRKDKVGDVLAQFKGPKGGPGDIYLYYDVPINLWRRWLAAPSKGHFFWQYIRNAFSYRKLTGDKKGKLKNAIN